MTHTNTPILYKIPTKAHTLANLYFIPHPYLQSKTDNQTDFFKNNLGGKNKNITKGKILASYCTSVLPYPLY